MNKTIYPLILLLALTSCLSKKQTEMTIEGALTGAAGQKIVLSEIGIHEIRPIDSVILKNDGGFLFEIANPDTGFLLLQGPNKKFLILVKVGPAEIRLTGDYSQFPDQVIVEGSPETRDLQRFFESSNINAKKADSVMKILRQHVDSLDYHKINLKTDSLLQLIWLDQKNLGMEYITGHPKDLSSLIVINYTFGVQAVISIHESYGIYRNLSDSLNIRYPGNEHVIHFTKTVDNYKPGSINLAP